MLNEIKIENIKIEDLRKFNIIISDHSQREIKFLKKLKNILKNTPFYFIENLDYYIGHQNYKKTIKDFIYFSKKFNRQYIITINIKEFLNLFVKQCEDDVIIYLWQNDKFKFMNGKKYNDMVELIDFDIFNIP